MNYKRLLIGVFLVIFTQSLFAQDLISAKETKKLLNDKNTVIVSARGATDYAKVHIRGAVNLPVGELAKEGEPEGILKSPAELAKVLGAKGISPDKKVIIYDSGSNKGAGRVYWVLKYLGFSDVVVLDGHMRAWRSARGPVTNAATSVQATTFTPKVNKAIFADMSEVKSSLGSAVLVDVRSADEFNQGHIQGAKHLEFKNVLTEGGQLKSKEELTALFNKAGITKNKEVILYCATSVRAGIVFLALNDILGYPKVKVYDGAYNEWKVN